MVVVRKTMILKVKCVNCGKEFSKEFDTTKVNRVMFGELVQDVFPELSNDDRELFFISNICGDCWDEMVPEDDITNEDIDKMAEEYYELQEDINNGK